jgi:hypothetical protein
MISYHFFDFKLLVYKVRTIQGAICWLWVSL